MFDWISHVPPVLEFIILVAAAVAALFALHKTVLKPLKKVYNKWDKAMDLLVGYPAIHDRNGKELKPPTPPLAHRVDALEEAMHRLIDINESMLSINERVLALEEWQKVHAEWSEQWVNSIQEENRTWQKEHEAMHLLAHETAIEVKKSD